MTLIELIKFVGEDKVLGQFLNESMTGIVKSKNGDSKITFETRELNPNHVATNTGPIGMVIWLPREEYMRSMNAGSN